MRDLNDISRLKWRKDWLDALSTGLFCKNGPRNGVSRVNQFFSSMHAYDLIKICYVHIKRKL